MHETRIIMHTSVVLRFSSIWNEKFGQKVQFWYSTFPLVIKFKLRNMRCRTFIISAWKVIDNPTNNSHYHNHVFPHTRQEHKQVQGF